MTFAREAWPFVLPFVALGAIVGLAGRWGWAAAALLAAFAVLLFFRVPTRTFDGDPMAVLAAADGKITAVGEATVPELGAGTYHQIVTFLSVFDVHVQRAPVSGEVVGSHYTAGRKVAAFRDDAGDVNENHLTVIRTDRGDLVAVRQIAGLLARRGVPWAEVGDRLERGQLMGLIKFGSRVDLFLPPTWGVEAEKGQRPRTGATVVGEIRPRS
jgi:phosphatidylserine decarboxylase